MRNWPKPVSRIFLGGSLIAVSLVALAAPLATGTWSLQFLGLFPLLVGISDLYTTVTSPERRSHFTSYTTGAIAIFAAFLLYVSPLMLVSGIVTLLLALLALDGILKLSKTIFRSPSTTSRFVSALNGGSSLCLAIIGWVLWRKAGGATAIGVAIAGYTAMAGWRLIAAPVFQQENIDAEKEIEAHPDTKLHLGQHPMFAAIKEQTSKSNPDVRRAEVYWFFIAGLVLLAIHVSRLDPDTWLGVISPFVATAGDVLMAIIFGALLVLPLRLGWRRLTRPIERKAWQIRLSGSDKEMTVLPRGLIREWTNARYSFSDSLKHARTSLPLAGTFVIRLGLPLALSFAAINPIWGTNWYFNTESWASGFYQKVTELRVDTWRSSMVDATSATYGSTDDNLFQVMPDGVNNQDFSFIVIGDTGEGDASQYSLVERYLEIGRRDDIKFLIVSSDVIYPAGAMKDYENNFYLPFKGFKRPIYAIPGNHDWFDALEAFNANFLEPKAARAALSARVKADYSLTSTDKRRMDHLLREAQFLRESYGIQNGKQRGPFFELQTENFALIAIDTGIRRTIDDRQLTWLNGALARSRGKFTMAIVGHPKYAGGYDTTNNPDEVTSRISELAPNWLSNPFISATYGLERKAEYPAPSTSHFGIATHNLYAMLERAGVDVVMAGDTHAFEYYLQEPGQGQNRRPVHYFVNGGGGAYLSVGGALAWPKTAPTKEWAFYPGTNAVYTKLDSETPTWKWPAWFWIKRFGAWPFSVEALSSLFDFNHAPFYQSFVEVRVERSRSRVVFALQGANGPVRWRDMDASSVNGLDGRLDEPVEFVVPLNRP